MNTRKLSFGLAVVFGIAALMFISAPDEVWRGGEKTIKATGVILAILAGVLFVVGLSIKKT